MKTNREHPINVRGPAVMQPGQYHGAYKIGRLRRYKALQQKGPITIFRAADRKRTMDAIFSRAATESGVYGINIHRANAHRPASR